MIMSYYIPLNSIIIIRKLPSFSVIFLSYATDKYNLKHDNNYNNYNKLIDSLGFAHIFYD